MIMQFYFGDNWPINRAVAHSSMEWDIWGLNLAPIELDTVLPTAHHCCYISSKRAVLPRCHDADMSPANLLRALVYYSKYYERFDLK